MQIDVFIIYAQCVIVWSVVNVLVHLILSVLFRVVATHRCGHLAEWILKLTIAE